MWSKETQTKNAWKCETMNNFINYAHVHSKETVYVETFIAMVKGWGGRDLGMGLGQGW